MARISLRIYFEPGAAEVVVNLKLRGEDGYLRTTATVDTGAEISLFPRHFLNQIDFRQSEEGTVEVEQAGIAQQSFAADECFVTLRLEGYDGNYTRDLDIKAWFGATTTALLGFAGVLDRAKLYIDMEDTRTGWIEVRDE